jgi:hypothetical protein
MSTGSEPPESSTFPEVSTVRLRLFRILAVLTGALFVFAGLTNARAGWMLVTGTSGDLNPELNRWFTVVAGASDLIMAGCWLALAWRPQWVLLFFNNIAAVVVAAVLNLPFVPEFAFVLAVVVPVIVAYPYWSQLRGVTTWWQKPHKVMLGVSALAAAVVFVVAAIAQSRQIGGTDVAAQANWWADYAEHISLIAIASLIASSGRPGWRVLAGLAAGVWLYLGAIAAFILPDHTASWSTLGGLAAMAVGAELAVTCVRGQGPAFAFRRSRGSRLAGG